MVALIVLSAIFAILLGAFLWFYFYSRTLAWGESDTRKAMLNMLIVVGPIFGMHYRRDNPEVPTISTPGPDHEPAQRGIITPPAEADQP